jgi:hypothetical protein
MPAQGVFPFFDLRQLLRSTYSVVIAWSRGE